MVETKQHVLLFLTCVPVRFILNDFNLFISSFCNDDICDFNEKELPLKQNTYGFDYEAYCVKFKNVVSNEDLLLKYRSFMSDY